ncbi:MAG: arginine--tRNA ligase [Deltaproteobacteria bacterium]|nr:arginine--tRNA ligase [Deltaproteobacteria bacterium]
MVEKRVQKLIKEAIESAVSDGVLEIAEIPEIELSTPRIETHGDLSTNIALVIASVSKKKPRDVAEMIAERISSGKNEIEKVSIAGPGFINFNIKKGSYLEILHEVYKRGEDFGKTNFGEGNKLQVEFVSANPTGPLHIGHGRGAVYGDVLSSVMEAAGYDVTREYYVNDAGGQMLTLGRSVYMRYLELSNQKVDYPKECYQGDYIMDIARELDKAEGKKLAAFSETEAIKFCSEYASNKILNQIKQDLAETGIIHDTYFHEMNLHTDAAIESSIRFLKKKGHLEERDGALWFKSTEFGDDKDRVLRKADGALTYFAADIAYHKNKFDRGFKRVIDIWGADHGGYVARMKAGIESMGYDPKGFDVVLIQLVNLMSGGEAVSMSTRAATYETLEDVRKEVGKDACRYFFLMRSHNAQLDFDLDLAKKESPDNPVFYIQYAHARICSVFRKAEEQGLILPESSDIDINLLNLPEEQKIARMLSTLPEVVDECATALEPHKLAFYLLELSRMFQSYYSQGKRDDRYRVLGQERKIAEAKLYLLKNIQIVIQNSLRILGISAPTKMEKEEEPND